MRVYGTEQALKQWRDTYTDEETHRRTEAAEYGDVVDTSWMTDEEFATYAAEHYPVEIQTHDYPTDADFAEYANDAAEIVYRLDHELEPEDDPTDDMPF